MKRKNRNKSIIKGWRNKLIFLLVVYFFGFATAVYCLAPVPQNTANRTSERSFAHSALKSDEFAIAFNEELHELINFGKSAASRAADLVNY